MYNECYGIHVDVNQIQMNAIPFTFDERVKKSSKENTNSERKNV